MRTIKIMGAMAAVVMILNGCSGYMLSSRGKDVIVDQISPDVFTVNFCGNAYMTQEEAEKYALQRASKAVLSKRYPYFIILEKRDSSELCETKPGVEQLVMPNVTLKVQGFSRLRDAPENVIDAKRFLREN